MRLVHGKSEMHNTSLNTIRAPKEAQPVCPRRLQFPSVGSGSRTAQIVPPRPPVPHLRRLVPHRRGEADLALERRAELSPRRPLLLPRLTARARQAPTGFQRLLALRGRRPGQHPTSAGQEAPTLSSPAPGERQPPSASAPSQRPPPSAAANYCRLQLPGAGSQERATPTPS